MDTWWSWGTEWIPRLQSLGQGWIESMGWVSVLGTEPFYMLILPAVFWSFDAVLGLRLGLILLGSAWLNSSLKLIGGLPRPYWVSGDVQALSAETSYGLPSGHAQTPLALYGRIAAHVRRRWLTAIVAAAVLLIGISRVTLAVHFPADVLAGWIVGGLFLAAFLAFEAPVGAWLRRRPLTTRLVSVVGLVAILVVVGGLLASFASTRMLPSDWVMNAMRADPHSEPIEPREVRDLLDPAATLLGLGLGAVLLFERGGFEAGAGGSKRLGRLALGLVGLLAIYYGLRAVFPGGETSLGLVLRFLRYTLVGFWVSYGAPRVFAWARLV
jgi:membrane-associated phospholipid phosphatase